MPHRQRRVRFALKCWRDDCDRVPRHQLADKDDATPPFIATRSAHIKTEVHFLEIAMEWNGKSDDARVEKKKTDHAEKCLALVEIQFRLTRHQRLQDFRIGDEIQHRQVTPVRGEKWFEHGGSSTSRSMLI